MANPITPQEVANIMMRVQQGTATPSDIAALTRIASSAKNLLTDSWKEFERSVQSLLNESGEMLISVVHSGSLSTTGKSKNSASCDAVEFDSGGEKYFLAMKVVVETAQEREDRLKVAKDAAKDKKEKVEAAKKAAADAA